MSSEISPDYSEASRPDLYATSIRRTKKILNALWGFQVSGQENVPKEGAAILAFVHRSYLDPWIIIPAAMKTGNLWRLEPILVSIGKPVAFSEEVDTISQRREAAVHIDELVRAGLQRCYDQVLGWTEPDIEDCLNSSSGVRAE
jgi:hypothetical protein